MPASATVLEPCQNLTDVTLTALRPARRWELDLPTPEGRQRPPQPREIGAGGPPKNNERWVSVTALQRVRVGAVLGSALTSPTWWGVSSLNSGRCDNTAAFPSKSQTASRRLAVRTALSLDRLTRFEPILAETPRNDAADRRK